MRFYAGGIEPVVVRPWAVTAPIAAAVIPAVDKCNAETAAWKRAIGEPYRDGFMWRHVLEVSS